MPTFNFPDFKNPKLLACALTHSSCAGEPGFDSNIGNYERLEFLGDSVLGLVVAEILYHAKIDNRKMAKLNSHIVSNTNLAKVCREIGLAVEARYSKGYLSVNNTASFAKAQADILEAYIGALYLDQGYDVARDFIISVLPLKYTKSEISSPKCDLQELTQVYGNTPEYYMINEEGPDHNKIFISGVKFRGLPSAYLVTSTGTGYSKKLSEQDAAKNAIREHFPEYYLENYED